MNPWLHSSKNRGTGLPYNSVATWSAVFLLSISCCCVDVVIVVFLCVDWLSCDVVCGCADLFVVVAVRFCLESMPVS